MRTLLAATSALALLASPALAGGDERAVSGPSPYGGCSAGTLQGAEASPALARPADPVVVWQQDTSHGGGGAIVSAGAGLMSTDGPLQGGCGPAGADGESAYAPSLATAPDGTVWAAAVLNGPEGGLLQVSSLAPRGRWRGELVAVAAPAVSGYVAASITVAPTSPATVHVAYVENTFPAFTRAFHRSHVVGSGAWSDEHLISLGPTPLAYDFHEQVVSVGGQDLVAVSTEVDNPSLRVLAPDYARYGDLTQAPIEHRVRRSTDGGVTWSSPVVALRLSNGGVRDREVPGPALRSLVRPSVVVGPDRRVHIAGESVAADGSSTEVLVASSCGASWCVQPAAVVPGIALAAAVAVDGAGRLATSWLDLGEDVQGDEVLSAQWRWSVAGQRGWSKPRNLTRAFDLRPLAPAYVGDQGALLGRKRGYVAAPVVGTGVEGNPSDVLLVGLR